ncbi:MAG: DUF1801 domain-containing protein [Myxococcota bacterium]
MRFEDPAVADAFASFTPKVRKGLLALRAMIYETAEALDGVGEITEALRWGQPSYLTSKPKSGTTIRLGTVGDDVALFVHCQTSLIEEFRVTHGSKLRYEGNRALLWKAGARIPKRVTKECIAAALLYHQRR